MSDIKLNAEQSQWLLAGLMLNAVDDDGNVFTLCDANQLELPVTIEEGVNRAEAILATLEALTADFTGELTMNSHEMSGLSFLFLHIRNLISVIDDESPKAQRALALMAKFDHDRRNAREASKAKAEAEVANTPTNDNQGDAE